jgi:hypothetical protein
MIEIHNLHKQVEAAKAKAREQALSYLSAQQKTKVKTLEDAERPREEIQQAHRLELLAAEQGAGPGGPGGPGFRGPGGPQGLRPRTLKNSGENFSVARTM